MHGLSVCNGDEVHPERDFEIGIFIKNFQNFIDVRFAAHFDYRAHTDAVALVAHLGDSRKFLFFLLFQFGDFAQKRRLVYLIRKFGDDDIFPIAVRFFHTQLCAQNNFPLARAISLIQLVRNDISACGKIGRLDEIHHIVQTDMGIIEIGNHAVDGFG